MNARLIDKTVSQLVRRRSRSDLSWRDANKIQNDFKLVLQKCGEPQRASLERAIEIVTSPTRGATLLDSDYIDAVVRLNADGYRETAIAIFASRVEIFKTFGFDALKSAMPDSLCADRWIKESKASRDTILKSVSSSPEEFFGTAWGDWYVKRAPVKSLFRFAALAMQGHERPAYLPTSQMLLMNVLARDRTGALTDQLLGKSLESESWLRHLLLAVANVSAAGEFYARTFGRGLGGDAAICRSLLAVVGDLIRVEDKRTSQFAADFIAHVTTTWRIVADPRKPRSEGLTKEIVEFSLGVWRLAQEDTSRDLWLTTSAHSLSEAIMQTQGDVSAKGALQIALGLRSAETADEARDALWSTAFNLGLREIGKESDIESFDPILHEDTKGGLMRGNRVRILKCGWSFNGSPLIRAEVEPV